MSTCQTIADSTGVFPGRGLYPILDLDTCLRRGREPAAVLRAWVDTGQIGYYQWRAKSLGLDDYLERARQWRTLAPGLAMLANDYPMAAFEARPVGASVAGGGTPPRLRLRAGFAGLHLGQDDLNRLSSSIVAELTRLSESPDAPILGLSTHNPEQVRRALRPDQIRWSYLAIGPCFSTVSKPTGHDPVLSRAELRQCVVNAVESVRERALVRPFPLVLIGGIQSANLGDLLASLQDLVANPDSGPSPAVRPLVATITGALDPGQISGMIQKIRKYSG